MVNQIPASRNDKQQSETPTLPSFSLAGRVCVVTGGAQGLGLVMSRALVLSGASVALVDLQSKFSFSFLEAQILITPPEETATREAENLVLDFKKAYPNSKKYPTMTPLWSLTNQKPVSPK